MTHCHTFIATLRQRGYRITPQREMIIETIAHSGHHMTAEEVSEIVRTRSKSVNIATVYRTLDFLVKEGMASRVDLGCGQTIYATTKHGPHIHLVCRQCGKIIEADYTLINPSVQIIQEHCGFRVDVQHLSLQGLCSDCR